MQTFTIEPDNTRLIHTNSHNKSKYLSSTTCHPVPSQSQQNKSHSPLLSLERRLRSLLPLTQLRLNANPAENTSDANPLHRAQAVTEPHNRDDHREHLSRDSHGDQKERAEDREGVDWLRMC
jgi:hypothetical protein